MQIVRKHAGRLAIRHEQLVVQPGKVGRRIVLELLVDVKLLGARTLQVLAQTLIANRHGLAVPDDLSDRLRLSLARMRDGKVNLRGKLIGQRANAGGLLHFQQVLEPGGSALAERAEANIRLDLIDALRIQHAVVRVAERGELLVNEARALQALDGLVPLLHLEGNAAREPVRVRRGLELGAGVAQARRRDVLQRQRVCRGLAQAGARMEELARSRDILVHKVLQLHEVRPGPLGQQQHDVQVPLIQDLVRCDRALHIFLGAMVQLEVVIQALQTACAVLSVALVVAVTQTMLALPLGHKREHVQLEDGPRHVYRRLSAGRCLGGFRRHFVPNF
eukprot:m.226833 g.226833  ORF g.226833 m.226833 type:complete len:334 (-) comp11490_c0_seq1:103-1104(-)